MKKLSIIISLLCCSVLLYAQAQVQPAVIDNIQQQVTILKNNDVHQAAKLKKFMNASVTASDSLELTIGLTNSKVQLLTDSINAMNTRQQTLMIQSDDLLSSVKALKTTLIFQGIVVILVLILIVIMYLRLLLQNKQLKDESEKKLKGIKEEVGVDIDKTRKELLSEISKYHIALDDKIEQLTKKISVMH